MSDPQFTREDVRFASAESRCAAWLYRPAGEGPHPGVVMAHGFGATREARLAAYAERFAAAGIAALVFDYRHFGSSEGEPRQLLDVRRQLDDWRAAVAHARVTEGIDARRIALWGTSFSGGHVVATAAGDPNVAAVVAQCPFTDGPSALRAAGPLNDLRLTWHGLRDALSALRGAEPHRIPIVAPPGEPAAMNSPDAYPGYLGLYSDEDRARFRNEFCARVALTLAAYRPARQASRARCPLLVCVCDEDVVTPPGPAERMARRAPRGESVHYPVGHFDVYVGEPFERAVADQTAFLTRHLGLSRAEAAAGERAGTAA